MKPRLLIIINRFVIGGQTSDTIPLLFHLKEKYTIHVLYGNKEKDEVEPLFLLDRYPGISISKVSSLRRTVNPLADILTFYRLCKCIRQFKPHIIHTHGAKSGLLGRLAAWICKIPIRIHTFHGHLFHSYFSRFITKCIITIERLLGNITDAAVALSESQKLEIVGQFKIFPAGKVHVIPLGIDAFVSNTKQVVQLRRQYQMQENDIVVAIISRIVPIKNHMDFLRIAINIISGGNSNFRFLIIGDGLQRNDLSAYLTQNNIAFSSPENMVANAQIIFTSWVSDMMEIMSQIDIVVLTSLNEGSPVSLIEAQLCGKPVIAYNVGGVKDTFINDSSGFLVEKGDIDGFTRKLLMLGNNREMRLKMGEAGEKFAAKKFSKQAEVNAIDQLYSKMLVQKSVIVE